MGRQTRPELDRWNALVERGPGCWGWKGTTGSSGYGQFRRDAEHGHRLIGAHVWAHLHFIGPVPDGWHVDHVVARGCLGAPCARPDHLEAVPAGENMRRRMRQTCFRGHDRDAPNARLGNGSCRTCHNFMRREATRLAAPT